MPSASNAGGTNSSQSFSKGGSVRVNGQQKGASRGESAQGAQGRSSGSAGMSAVRPNGRQQGGTGEDGEYQGYRQSYARNSEKIKPTKTGSVRG